MDLRRLLAHLCTPAAVARRRFPPAVLDAIEAAVARNEAGHDGQIRFAVEAALPPGRVLRGVLPRERALEVFGLLRVWDTARNNGVLIYLLLADRHVEIVADRGIHACAADQWDPICRAMEAAFARGDFAAGVLAGVDAVGAQLQRHFPGQPAAPNELPDRPVVL